MHTDGFYVLIVVTSLYSQII